MEQAATGRSSFSGYRKKMAAFIRRDFTISSQSIIARVPGCHREGRNFLGSVVTRVF